MRKKWISVDKRLPEPLVDVLVYKITGTIETDCILPYSRTFMHKNVTHWMPLPEPPVMERGAE